MQRWLSYFFFQLFHLKCIKQKKRILESVNKITNSGCIEYNKTVNDFQMYTNFSKETNCLFFNTNFVEFFQVRRKWLYLNK